MRDTLMRQLGVMLFAVGLLFSLPSAAAARELTAQENALVQTVQYYYAPGYYAPRRYYRPRPYWRRYDYWRRPRFYGYSRYYGRRRYWDRY